MAKSEVIAGPQATPAYPIVRKIGPTDIRDVLAKGIDDFLAMPTQVIFICIIYPIAGLILGRVAFGYDLLPLLFPLASGFALVGPFLAIGLYELSRRRELGLETSWRNVWEPPQSSALGPILALGAVLVLIFLLWLGTAQLLYWSIFGSETPESILGFFGEMLTTPRGWTLIVLGHAIGFIFAVVVLAISVISFPLLLDKDVGVAVAVQTSIRAVQTNPAMMALWGLIVTGGLMIGTLPLFVGLAVVMPVLGHSTWHLYRRVVDASSVKDAQSR